MTQTEENMLLGALGRSEERAFVRLYEEYSKVSYAFAVALLKDETLAKDVVQDTFVKIWTRRAIVSRASSFKSYLFKMLRNAVLDQLENTEVFNRYLEWAMNSNQISPAYDAMNFRELWGLIMEAVNLMPSQRKRVFEMSRIEAMSNQQIADALGINLRTVENHLSNALRDIREHLTRSYV